MAEGIDLPAPSVVQVSSMTVKPGWKTTEFWMTALTNLGLVLAACVGVLPPQYAALAGALSQVAYNVSRGLAKRPAGN